MLVTILFVGIVSSQAQVGSLNSVAQPISPNASALGKYVEMPVSNFSGLPDINIPLYDFKVKDLNIPISLSYHASGIKVRDIPSMVGAGWSLNAGGVITRIVRGYPDGDDMSDPGPYKENIETMGFPGGHTFPPIKSMFGVEVETLVDKLDTEFDLFYFNFMGHSGRFTFDKTGNVMMLEVNNMKAEYYGDFKLTDENGVVYTFEKEETEYSPVLQVHYITNWYLTEVEIPFKNQLIKFNYETAGSYRVYYGKPNYYIKVRTSDASPYYDSSWGTIANPSCDSFFAMIGGNELSTNTGFAVKEIISGTDTVKFYNNFVTRADMYSARVDSIKVRSGGSSLQTVKFTYGYSNSNSDGLLKKMMLSSVKVNDQTPYTFDYFGSYMDKTMTGILAKGEDFWGFYNGEDYPESPNGDYIGPRFKELMPSMPVLWESNSSYKNPDYKYGQIGSLKAINYPTGGKTEFEYEGNDFSHTFYGTNGNFGEDNAVAIQMDSVRTTGISSSSPFSYLNSKEITIHHNQTATINTKIGITYDVDGLDKYYDYIYNGGYGY